MSLCQWVSYSCALLILLAINSRDIVVNIIVAMFSEYCQVPFE